MVTLFLFLVASPLFAATAKNIYVCPPATTVTANLEECADNGPVASAGINCTRGLGVYLKNRKQQLAADMAALTASLSKNNSQSNGTNTAKLSYQTTNQALAEMLQTTVASKVVLTSYLDSIYFPEPEDTSDVEEFLSSEKCYTEPRDILNAAIKETDKVTADLTATQVQTIALAKQSGVNTSLINDGNTNQQQLLKAREYSGADNKGLNFSGSTVSKASATENPGSSNTIPSFSQYLTPGSPMNENEKGTPWIDNLLSPTTAATPTK